ncbi:hypothetical protein Rsub_01047 [Raphidocelis subcapitata]|uniref:Uncharacterized protein n=1 Tax=Raphidocelis subcapitata TaxID=307507 RepID=A0A2V0NU27_9CHLO|nr:hypothetical protein Rsub_01047 [Raphidocelis subcapitata]|eukprot:GBF88335.1 hypothetical protein Rsub_01047 [Raphidocelis subcapitata]
MTGPAPTAPPPQQAAAAAAGAAAPPAAPAQQAGGSGLSEAMRRAIHGEVTPQEKDAQLKGSLQRWWKEYAGRKNEEEDMVADSLMYDERCHLPRTTAGPRFDDEPAQPAQHTAAAPQHKHAHGAGGGHAAA